jgi:hypothetical protein
VKTKRRSWGWAGLGIAIATTACSAHDAPISATSGTAGTGGAGTGGESGTGGNSGIGGSAVGDSGLDVADANDAAPIVCSPDSSRIAEKIACLPGVKVVRDEIRGGLPRVTASMLQPVDHDNPDGPSFRQYIAIFHVDETAPVDLTSSGYVLGGKGMVSDLFRVNSISVEERFFHPTDPVYWNYLSIRQSSADFHAIVETFKTIYKGKWIGSGASKGGCSAVYHRRFYPNDVEGTVAYVAPNLVEAQDRRFPPFLAAIGGDDYAECRAKLHAFQRAILAHRDEVTPLMQGSYQALGGNDVVLEDAAVRMPFWFWQYGAPDDELLGCRAIPTADAPPQTILDFLNQMVPLDYFTDTGSVLFEPYYYQTEYQIGAPLHAYDHLQDLLRHGGPIRSYLSAKVPPPQWDGEATADIQRWVNSDAATKMVFTYGEYDPWTAARFEVPAGGEKFAYTLLGTNHGASVRDLPPEERARAMSAIGRWIGLTPPPLSAALRMDEDDAPRRRRMPL